MRKIGIITHWHVPNYGSFLQAYALRNVICKLFPETIVELVGYIKPVHIKMYYSYEVREIFKLWMINPFYYIDFVKRVRRRAVIKEIRTFIKYYDSYLPHTNCKSLDEINRNGYDVIILGSDILWDYSIAFFGQDPIMFGCGIEAKKISYAASFGTIKEVGFQPSYVVKGLSELEFISVRDNNSKRIVRDLIDTNIDVVLDPTFLWDFNNDENIELPDEEKEYIVVYGNEFTEAQVHDIVEYSKTGGFLLIALDDDSMTLPWCDKHVGIRNLTPFQWCGYIKKSSIVMTCTFHGLMFSLIYEKPILFNATNFMRDKAAGFIEEIGLADLLLTNKPIREVLSNDWGAIYRKAYDPIKKLKKLSVDYLVESLSDDKGRE